jgi:K(+)-stimulated pyrophosphate-energized sodium pump
MKQPAGNAKMQEIALAIQEGSRAFLQREYTWLAVFVAVTAVVQVAAIGGALYSL